MKGFEMVVENNVLPDSFLEQVEESWPFSTFAIAIKPPPNIVIDTGLLLQLAQIIERLSRKEPPVLTKIVLVRLCQVHSFDEDRNAMSFLSPCFMNSLPPDPVSFKSFCDAIMLCKSPIHLILNYHPNMFASGNPLAKWKWPIVNVSVFSLFRGTFKNLQRKYEHLLPGNFIMKRKQPGMIVKEVPAWTGSKDHTSTSQCWESIVYFKTLKGMLFKPLTAAHIAERIKQTEGRGERHLLENVVPYAFVPPQGFLPTLAQAPPRSNADARLVRDYREYVKASIEYDAVSNVQRKAQKRFREADVSLDSVQHGYSLSMDCCKAYKKAAFETWDEILKK
jgi:hypothetical protein